MLRREREYPAKISFEQLNYLKKLPCKYCTENETHNLHVCYNHDRSRWVEWTDGQKQFSFSQRHPIKAPSHIEIWQCESEGNQIIRVERVMALVIFEQPIFSNLFDIDLGTIDHLAHSAKVPKDRVTQEKAKAWLLRQCPEIPDEEVFQIIDREKGITLERMRGSSFISATLKRGGDNEEEGDWVETWQWKKDGQLVSLKRIEIYVDLKPSLFAEILPLEDQVHLLNQVLVRKTKSLSSYTRSLFTDSATQNEAFTNQLSEIQYSSQ